MMYRRPRRGGWKKLTPEQCTIIITEYRAGLRLSDIADLINRQRQTVVRCVQRSDIQRRTRAWKTYPDSNYGPPVGD